MIGVIATLFGADPDKADVCFALAWIILWATAIVALVGRSIVDGLALIALGFIPLAWLFITP